MKYTRKIKLMTNNPMKNQFSKIDWGKIIEYKEITKLQNLSTEIEKINKKNTMIQNQTNQKMMKEIRQKFHMY